MDPLDEIARLRARVAPPDALAEIQALRDRIARIEKAALAAAVPTQGETMHDAIRSHYSPATPPPDRERARLRSLADRFVPDPQYEATIAARARIGAEAYDAEMRRVGAYQGMELAIYGRSRDAAIKLGTFVPAKEEGTK